MMLGILVFFASVVGTLSGFGASTIMVPVLLLFFPLPVTLLFVGIIHWFGDMWKMLFFRGGVWHWRVILWFAIPGVVASFFGASLSVKAPEELLLRILGVFLLGYVFFLFLKPEWKLPGNKKTAALGGFSSGFVAGIFGVGGAIRGAFLSAFNFPKEVYLFTSGATALFIDSTRIVGYVSSGTRLEGLFFWGLFGFVPLSFLGAWAAKGLVDRIPQNRFRMVLALFLAAAAVKFLLFP